jgi:hypothetical protein
MRKMAVLLVGAVCAFCIFFCTPAAAQEKQQPPLQEEVIVRWWLVPVYAIDKSGAPVLNLSTDDLEVFIKGTKVEQFTLHKKEFKVTETKKGAAPAQPTPSPQPQVPPQKKMVFLVFDAAATPMALLAKAKTICDEVMARSDKSAQYVLLSIEPLAGLHYISGPTQDLGHVTGEMKRFITGKKMDYLHSSRVDNSSIRDIYPHVDGSRVPVSSPGDKVTMYQMTNALRSSLKTLCLILGYFPEYSKVVYLYSCGSPWISSPGGPGSGFDPDDLPALGRELSKNGALLFVVNPAGSRVFENDPDSGEGTLRTLASASGGRYYDGGEKEIVQEVNNMEGGYYEISFPDKPEYEGQELSFEIRSKNPEISIYSVKAVGREKSFADMNELEKEVLILNVLNRGPFALTKEKVIPVEVKTAREGGEFVCRLTLPAELAKSEYTVFKVARNFEKGDIRIDKENAVPESPELEIRMKWRGEGYRHDVVLVQMKTGTIIVAK